MNRNERTLSAVDTLEQYHHTDKSLLSTRSEYITFLNAQQERGDHDTVISVVSEDVVDRIFLTSATMLTGVLNFASPVRPGGGYLTGASAQEESLCRVSFLAPELAEFEDEYYQVNRRHLSAGMYLPHFIYSHDVKFIKRPVNGQEIMVDPVFTDVITMAAPNKRLNDGSYTDADYTIDITYKLEQVLRAFKRNGREAIILGAFGCGVFGNDPQVVAKVFDVLLRSDEFAGVFKEVYFSVYGQNENLDAFEAVFDHE